MGVRPATTMPDASERWFTAKREPPKIAEHASDVSEHEVYSKKRSAGEYTSRSAKRGLNLEQSERLGRGEPPEEVPLYLTLSQRDRVNILGSPLHIPGILLHLGEEHGIK